MGGDSIISAGGTALVTAKGGGGGGGWHHSGPLVYSGPFSGGSGGGAVGSVAYPQPATDQVHWSGWGALGTPGQGNDGGSCWRKVARRAHLIHRATAFDKLWRSLAHYQTTNIALRVGKSANR